MKEIKSYTGFLLIILIFLSFGIFTMNGLFSLGQLTKTIYEHPLVVSNASLHAALNITKMHRSMKDVVLANSPMEIEYALHAVKESEIIVFQQLDIIKKDILGDEGQALEQQTRQLFIDWQPIREEVVQLMNTGNLQKATLITKGKGAKHVETLESKMFALTSYARNKATNFLNHAESSQSKLEKITMILTFSGVLTSIIIAFIAIKRLLLAKTKILDKNNELQQALHEIKTLQGIIPICSYCKKIRDDKGAWDIIEAYICKNSDAQFSHGVCPECYKTQMEN